jgi:hypothetical protein
VPSVFKRILPLVAVAVLCLPTSANAYTCAGSCGAGSMDGSCYCDEDCFGYEDCCDDICTQCPTLSGCGGGAGDCGNGYCEPSEDASTCPQDCNTGCGNISFEGCCNGQTLQFCEAGELKSIDCNQQPSCGWQPTGPFYDCGTDGTPDPSGQNPLACGGGTAPVCGNGICEAGENTSTCPTDCDGGQPVCGNGSCEAGESAQTCPADCGGGGPGCADKQCGFDSQGNPCGTCPEGFFCTWEGHCESAEPCEGNCEGKQCGDDGCGDSCGTCPAGLMCSDFGMCVSPYGDVIEQPEEDVVCYPDCTGRVCGNDGCGGSCGVCPEGYGCTGLGLCEEGYVPPEPDVVVDTGGGTSGYSCPPGESLIYGKCVATGDETGEATSCTVAASPQPTVIVLFLLLLISLSVMRRRTAL